MSKNNTVEGYPGGNWPSGTGNPSGGNRGNAPGPDADWGWDDDDNEGENILEAMERSRQDTMRSLQQMPSPPRKSSTPWWITGVVEFFLWSSDFRRIKLKGDDTLYHLDERVMQAYGLRNQAEYFQNIRPGDSLTVMAYRWGPGTSNRTYICRIRVENWDHEVWVERAKNASRNLRLNKEAYDAHREWINTQRTIKRGRQLTTETCPSDEIDQLRQTQIKDLCNEKDPVFRGDPEIIDAIAHMFAKDRVDEIRSYLIMRWTLGAFSNHRVSRLLLDIKRNLRTLPIREL